MSRAQEISFNRNGKSFWGPRKFDFASTVIENLPLIPFLTPTKDQQYYSLTCNGNG